jgi:hypothetical protein
MPQKGDDWTASEESTLQNHWDTHTAQEIADMLPNRTLDAVYSKHQRMKESSSTAIQTAPDPVNSDDQDGDVKRITVNKEDIKEGYEFNHKSDEYTGRQHAVIEVRGNKASLSYHEEGHRYPEGGSPEFSLLPQQFVEESSFADYPVRHMTEDRVADEFPELDRGTEVFKEKVDAWFKEEKEVFWNSVEWKQKIELNPHQKELTGFDRVIVEYR